MTDTTEPTYVGSVLGNAFMSVVELFELLKTRDLGNTPTFNPVNEISRLPRQHLTDFLKKYPTFTTDHKLVVYCTNDRDDEQFSPPSNFIREMVKLMKTIYHEIDHEDLKRSMLSFMSAVYDHVHTVLGMHSSLIRGVDFSTNLDEAFGDLWNNLMPLLRPTNRFMNESEFMNYLAQHVPNFNMCDKISFHPVYDVIDAYLTWGVFCPAELNVEHKYKASFITEMKNAYTAKQTLESSKYSWGNLASCHGITPLSSESTSWF